MCDCEGKLCKACKTCQCNFSNDPKNPNGVLFVLKEPGGGSEKPTTREENREGSGDWYNNTICKGIVGTENKRTASAYRNRFINLLSLVEKSAEQKDLENCYYANICYGRKGKNVSIAEGFKSLDDETVKKRFTSILNEFMEILKEKCNTIEVYIFLVDEAYQKIDYLNKEKNAGIIYGKRDKYPMDTIKYGSIECKIYAVHHPIRAKADVEFYND